MCGSSQSKQAPDKAFQKIWERQIIPTLEATDEVVKTLENLPEESKDELVEKWRQSYGTGFKQGEITVTKEACHTARLLLDLFEHLMPFFLEYTETVVVDLENSSHKIKLLLDMKKPLSELSDDFQRHLTVRFWKQILANCGRGSNEEIDELYRNFKRDKEGPKGVTEARKKAGAEWREKDIAKLYQKGTLDLSYYKLKQVPDAVYGFLEKTDPDSNKTLILTGNRIKILHPTLFDNGKVEALFLEGNPLRYVPEEVTSSKVSKVRVNPYTLLSSKPNVKQYITDVLWPTLAQDMTFRDLVAVPSSMKQAQDVHYNYIDPNEVSTAAQSAIDNDGAKSNDIGRDAVGNNVGTEDGGENAVPESQVTGDGQTEDAVDVLQPLGSADTDNDAEGNKGDAEPHHETCPDATAGSFGEDGEKDGSDHSDASTFEAEVHSPVSAQPCLSPLSVGATSPSSTENEKLNETLEAQHDTKDWLIKNIDPRESLLDILVRKRMLDPELKTTMGCISSPQRRVDRLLAHLNLKYVSTPISFVLALREDNQHEAGERMKGYIQNDIEISFNESAISGHFRAGHHNYKTL